MSETPKVEDRHMQIEQLTVTIQTVFISDTVKSGKSLLIDFNRQDVVLNIKLT